MKVYVVVEQTWNHHEIVMIFRHWEDANALKKHLNSKKTSLKYEIEEHDVNEYYYAQ